MHHQGTHPRVSRFCPSSGCAKIWSRHPCARLHVAISGLLMYESTKRVRTFAVRELRLVNHILGENQAVRAIPDELLWPNLLLAILINCPTWRKSTPNETPPAASLNVLAGGIRGGKVVLPGLPCSKRPRGGVPLGCDELGARGVEARVADPAVRLIRNAPCCSKRIGEYGRAINGMDNTHPRAGPRAAGGSASAVHSPSTLAQACPHPLLG